MSGGYFDSLSHYYLGGWLHLVAPDEQPFDSTLRRHIQRGQGRLPGQRAELEAPRTRRRLARRPRHRPSCRPGATRRSAQCEVPAACRQRLPSRRRPGGRQRQRRARRRWCQAPALPSRRVRPALVERGGDAARSVCLLRADFGSALPLLALALLVRLCHQSLDFGRLPGRTFRQSQSVRPKRQSQSVS